MHHALLHTLYDLMSCYCSLPRYCSQPPHCICLGQPGGDRKSTFIASAVQEQSTSTFLAAVQRRRNILHMLCRFPSFIHDVHGQIRLTWKCSGDQDAAAAPASTEVSLRIYESSDLIFQIFDLNLKITCVRKKPLFFRPERRNTLMSITGGQRSTKLSQQAVAK